jgi:MFS family permease
VFATSILVMVVGYGMVNPLGPAIVAEMFPTRIRYSGAAISSQLGLIVTGFAPTIAAAVVRPGPDGWVPVAVFTAVCCGISALVTLLWVRETYRVDTDDLGKKAI